MSAQHASLRSVIVIPARLSSRRLARKLLLNDTGKPLIQHTYESASRATRPAAIVVAADCDEIVAAVRSFGGRAMFTNPSHASGTDRVAEVAESMPEVDIFVNVQGDEPEISAAAIDAGIQLLERNAGDRMSTLAAPIRSREELQDPSCVKVVFNQEGRANYFSRAPIPFAREWDDSLLTREPAVYFRHVGVYAYRREFLLSLTKLPRSCAERIEDLEQLRVLQAGFTILVAVVDEPTVGIDTADDYRAFVDRYKRRIPPPDPLSD